MNRQDDGTLRIHPHFPQWLKQKDPDCWEKLDGYLVEFETERLTQQVKSATERLEKIEKLRAEKQARK